MSIKQLDHGRPIPITAGQLEKRRRDKMKPEIDRWIIKINEHLLEHGIGYSLDIDSLPDQLVRNAVSEAFARGGLEVRFKSDQRDGCWVQTQAARAVGSGDQF